MKPKETDWRGNAAATDDDPDDTELAQTPPDVVAVLGFDPKQEAAEARRVTVVKLKK